MNAKTNNMLVPPERSLPFQIRFGVGLGVKLLAVVTCALLGTTMVYAQTSEYRLEGVVVDTDQPGEVQVRFEFSEAGAPPQPESFAITNPHRIAVDFAQTAKSEALASSVPGAGSIERIGLAEEENRLRATLSLVDQADYRLQRTDRSVVVSVAKQSTPEETQAVQAAPAQAVAPENDEATASQGAAVALIESVDFTSLPGERVQVFVKIQGTVPTPQVFATTNPPRLAIDLPNARSIMKERTRKIEMGNVRSIGMAEVKDRVRLVVNLGDDVDYDTQVGADGIRITMGPPGIERTDDSEMVDALRSESARVASASRRSDGSGDERVGPQVENVDFRRGGDGGGRIVVKLSDAQVPVDIRRKPGGLVIDLYAVGLSQDLAKRLDVTDFSTPVRHIEVLKTVTGVRMEVDVAGEFTHMAYQTNERLTVEVNEPVQRRAADAEKDVFDFTGDRLSLNFQDIEVRSVLQLIADFTGFNIVVSDSVTGSVTLRLQDVPWDQALDIVLKTKSLGNRMEGNVMLIAPLDEIAEREKKEAEARRQQEVVAPLFTEFVKINYARANDIVTLIEDRRGRRAVGDQNMRADDQGHLLSERGSISVDQRTNTIMIRDTEENLELIRLLIRQLDVPVRQVLIESRIVSADNDFSHNLGVRAGFTTAQAFDNQQGVAAITGSSEGSTTIIDSASANVINTGRVLPVALPELADRLNVNSPSQAAGNNGRFGVAILGSDFLLDLELSALQAEGRGEIISTPRVITMDQQEATIKQGEEIPYQESAGASGATSTSFKEAALSLKVTPQITPDGRISMSLEISRDSRGQVTNGIPAINTQEVSTTVLVNNGETVVLGGIQEQEKRRDVTKIPLLGDLPLIGWLFRQTSIVETKGELLIFITPKIIHDNLVATDASS